MYCHTKIPVLDPPPSSFLSLLSISLLSNNDIKLKVLSLLNTILCRNISTINVQNRLLSLLTLASLGLISSLAVVLRQGLDTSDVISQTGDDINPRLVQVHAEGNGESFLALLILEAQQACGAAVAHVEGQHAVLLCPLAAVGVVPAGLLDNVEVGVLVGLVDTDFDGVGHSGGVSQAIEERRGDRLGWFSWGEL